jgi:hypothetical protein
MYTLTRNRIYDLTDPVSSVFTNVNTTLSSTFSSDPNLSAVGISIVGDKSGNQERVLSYYSPTNTVRLHQYNGSTWDVIFTKTSQLSSYGTDIDLSGDFFVIGIPEFRNGTGKIESWYFDSEISGRTEATPFSGWNLVTYTHEETYDGLTGTNYLSSTAGLGYNVAIAGNDVLIASTSGTSNLDVFEYNMLYKGNLQVRRFVSTNKVKMIETNDTVDYVKILEMGTENKYNIYDPVRNVNIGLLYPSKQFLQNNASGNPKLNQNILSDTKLQAPDGPIDQIAQLDNTALALKDETTENIKYYSFVDGEYQELPNAMVLYDIPTLSAGSPVFDIDYVNSLSAPRVALSGIEYAYFGEMPINDIFYDFDYGELYIDMFNLHNELDYKYDTDAYTSPNVDIVDSTDVFLSNTRDYERMGINENTIWVSYRVGQNYSSTLSGVVVSNDTYPAANAPMSKTTKTSGDAYDYAYIERLAGANRTSTTAHKSNIYSIEITNSNLNTNITDLSTRNYLQSIVERAILNFQEKVAPVHTQLWKIIWRGL